MRRGGEEEEEQEEEQEEQEEQEEEQEQEQEQERDKKVGWVKSGLRENKTCGLGGEAERAHALHSPHKENAPRRSEWQWPLWARRHSASEAGSSPLSAIACRKHTDSA